MITIYRNLLTTTESMCVLKVRGARHAEPDMEKTYAEMVKELYSNKLFLHTDGRGTVKEILDAFAAGHRLIDWKGWAGFDTQNEGEETIVYYDEDDLNEGLDIEE